MSKGRKIGRRAAALSSRGKSVPLAPSNEERNEAISGGETCGESREDLAAEGTKESSCGACEAARLKEEIAALRGELDAERLRASLLERELESRTNDPIDYAAVAENEEFIDEYAVKSAVLRERIVTDYLRSLSGARGGARLLGERIGGVPLAPPRKPKNLDEAKRLAELFIKN